MAFEKVQEIGLQYSEVLGIALLAAQVCPPYCVDAGAAMVGVVQLCEAGIMLGKFSVF